jgi:hypothetical protein
MRFRREKSSATCFAHSWDVRLELLKFQLREGQASDEVPDHCDGTMNLKWNAELSEIPENKG